MIRRFCDGCGAEISKDDRFFRIALCDMDDYDGTSRPQFYAFCSESDYCGECASTMTQKRIRFEHDCEHLAVKSHLDDEASETSTTKTKKRKPLDTGKILALHNAGWTYKMIAEEMHCSMSTIYNVLINSKKEEDNDK